MINMRITGLRPGLHTNPLGKGLVCAGEEVRWHFGLFIVISLLDIYFAGEMSLPLGGTLDFGTLGENKMQCSEGRRFDASYQKPPLKSYY